jgi:hypothetical protein
VQFRPETRQQTRLQLTRYAFSKLCGEDHISYHTFAIEDVVLACLLLDLDLSLDLGRDGGSELAACIVGRLVNGSMVPPGLADRDIRGQAIASSYPQSTRTIASSSKG